MTTIRSADGLALEAHWDEATGSPLAAAVLCHPHPLDGGTMHAPLLGAVARALNEAGVHVLRFNFRGVGTSEGAWGEGVGEVEDVAGAVEAAGMAFPGIPLGLAGWSFGATASLRWQARERSGLPWAGIAPGIGSYRDSTVPDFDGLEPADRLIIIGDRDQFASVDSMKEFADGIGARLEVVPASDHFFVFRGDMIASLVAAHFSGL